MNVIQYDNCDIPSRNDAVTAEILQFVAGLSQSRAAHLADGRKVDPASAGKHPLRLENG
jgi:hypothetical protein